MLVKQGDTTNYNYKIYYVDTEEDMNEINVDDCCPGTICYIIKNKKVFMLSEKNKEWIEQ